MGPSLSPPKGDIPKVQDNEKKWFFISLFLLDSKSRLV
jgi:hypothetical protein